MKQVRRDEDRTLRLLAREGADCICKLRHLKAKAGEMNVYVPYIIAAKI